MDAPIREPSRTDRRSPGTRRISAIALGAIGATRVGWPTGTSEAPAVTTLLHPSATDPSPSAAPVATPDVSARAAAVDSPAALLAPDAAVAPSLALLAARTWELAGDHVAARWLRPALPALLDTTTATRDEAARAQHAATLARTLAEGIRQAVDGDGTFFGDGFFAAWRRTTPAATSGSLLRRLDVLGQSLADPELLADAARRLARLAAAAASVAAAPDAVDASARLVRQERALRQPLPVRPAGAAPADASPAWAAAWATDDPRAGAAVLATAYAAQAVRLALRTPDVNAEAVHAAVARTLLRMAGEGRGGAERETLAALVGATLPADVAGAVRGTSPVDPALAAEVAAGEGSAAADALAAQGVADVGAPTRGRGPVAIAVAASGDALTLVLDTGVTVAVPTARVRALAELPAGALSDARAAAGGTQVVVAGVALGVRPLLVEVLDLVC